MRLKRRSKVPVGLLLFLCLGGFAAILAIMFLVISITDEPVEFMPVAIVACLLLSAAFGVYSYSETPQPKPDDTEARAEAAFAEAVRAFERAVPPHPKEGMFSVPVMEVIDTPRVVVEVMKTILKGPHSDIRRQLNLNRAEVSGMPYRQDIGDLVPEKMKGTPREIVDSYLKGTSLKGLFDRRIPIAFDDETRFQHTFIVGPTGTGKTNLLHHFLERDFARAQKGECSVIVMDSTGDLLPELTRLEQFAIRDGESRLVLADTNDDAFPLALSLFDLGLKKVSSENRAAFRNSATSLIAYLFRALLDMELTGHQTTALSFAIEVLVEVPSANLSDLIAFLKPNGAKRHQPTIDQMRPAVRSYFRDTFNSPDVQKRKNEVVARLDGLNARTELSNMFEAREARLNLFDEMNKGKVILINVPRQLLQKEGVEIFGRYFIAMILLAAERRVDIPERRRLPCFLYIDECQNVLYRDEKIAEMLDGVRKFKVGVTLLTQRVGDFNDRVLDAIIGNVATTFASKVKDPIASRFARFMNTRAEFITNQPDYHFALHSRHVTKAVSVPIPKATLTVQPRMTNEHFKDLRALMRERYATPVEELHRRVEDGPIEGPATQDNEPPPSPQRPTKW